MKPLLLALAAAAPLACLATSGDLRQLEDRLAESETCLAPDVGRVAENIEDRGAAIVRGVASLTGSYAADAVLGVLALFATGVGARRISRRRKRNVVEQ